MNTRERMLNCINENEERWVALYGFILGKIIHLIITIFLIGITRGVWLLPMLLSFMGRRIFTVTYTERRD